MVDGRARTGTWRAALPLLVALGLAERGDGIDAGVAAPTGPVRPGPVALVQGGPCSPEWLPTFGGQPGMDGEVLALAVFDDGAGPALYAGGTFDVAGGAAASEIAKWDGSTWIPVGGGIQNGVIYALTVFDDGSGPALFAAGGFVSVGGTTANGIAKWDGTSWSPLGSGFSGGIAAASSMIVFDDGGGPALYVTGSFTSAGGISASHIAKWDGASWSPVGSGLDRPGFALTVFDDGSGPALYAGGDFTSAGGVSASGIARWDGTSWSALGTGMAGGTGDVLDLAVFDDGGGPALYAGGSFTSAGGISASRIARWDGASWSALGSGMNGMVYSLAAHDDGSGPALYAGGSFTTADGVAAEQLARWDGLAWSPLGDVGGPSLHSVAELVPFDDGSGSRLVAVAWFVSSRGSFSSRIATWDGASWTTLGAGLDDTVRALAMYDDGGGTALHAAGSFTAAGSVTVNRVVKWDGSGWVPLGSGTNGDVQALAVFDDGGGPALCGGGAFTSAGGVTASRIARWDGSQWSSLGIGTDGPVHCLAVFDDGSGPALYAGGSFTSAGGVAASAIARWNGASWSPLGSGMDAFSTPAVYALAVYDDGSGPALYAGGDFTSAGGTAAQRIARWDGVSWTNLGTGTSGDVYALTVFDAGDGSELYAAGAFGTAGGVAGVARIARWNGASWSKLAETGMQADIFALAVFDDGSGPALVAGGAFTAAAGVAANRIARWDGASWSALGPGVGVVAPSAVRALAVAEEPNRQTLRAGGEFAATPSSGDSFLAAWSGCPDSLAPELVCPASVRVLDPLSGPPGEIVHFTVTASDHFDPAPLVVCVPPSGTFFPRGTTIVTCTATDATGNQSTCQFPVHVSRRVRER